MYGRYIIYDDRRLLTKDRWKEYLTQLLNVVFPREAAVDQVKWNWGMVDLIREEDRVRLKKLK